MEERSGLDRRGLSISIAVGVVLLAGYWYQNSAQRNHDMILGTRHYPPLIVGRRLQIAGLIHSNVRRDPLRQSDSQCQLVLVVEDSCQFCRKALTIWSDA